MALVSYSLTNLAAVKETLGITTGDDDDLLEDLINRATDAIERYCNGRRFASTAYTNEEYNGRGNTVLTLRHYPVTELDSLQWRTGDFSTPSWESLDSEFYKLLDSGEDMFSPGQIYHSGGFEAGVKNYRVSYTAGWTTIPYDLEQACIKIVSFFKDSIKTMGMKSETLGEYSYTKSDTETTIKQLGLDEVLDAYRTPVLNSVI